MSLREQAAADLRGILTDASGFGWPITLVSPAGARVALTGLSTDVYEMIDPETGQAVTGRRASIALPMLALDEAGIDLPHGVAQKTARPFVAEFADIRGAAHSFKVREAKPDRALGVVVCILEAYKPAST